MTFSALHLSVPPSVIPSSYTWLSHRGKPALLMFWLFYRLKCGQLLLHLLMRKMGRRNRNYNIALLISLCWKDKTVHPENTMQRVQWDWKCYLQRKVVFFFLWIVKMIKEGKITLQSTCTIPSHVIKSERATVQAVAIWIFHLLIVQPYHHCYDQFCTVKLLSHHSCDMLLLGKIIIKYDCATWGSEQD